MVPTLTDEIRGTNAAHSFMTPYLLDTLVRDGLKRVGIGHTFTQAMIRLSVMQNDTRTNSISNTDHCDNSADNADSNIGTINGLSSFDGMGIMRNWFGYMYNVLCSADQLLQVDDIINLTLTDRNPSDYSWIFMYLFSDAFVDGDYQVRR